MEYLKSSNFWTVCPILEIQNAKNGSIQISFRGKNEYSMFQIRDKKIFLW